jgi:LDH2 family malate/lactate/ureidoglycolate dehydrogenase
MIGIAMTNASPLVAPTFSVDKMLGTNPIAVAAPAGEEPPFVADLATTTAANGKLEILQRKNLATPDGWVQDEAGNASTDAHILKKGGALLPLGGDREHGSHKGYALGAMVDLFSALLSGANYAPWVPPFPAYVPMPAQQPGKGIGHFIGAIRVDAFRTSSDYKKDMDHWIRGFRNAKPINGQKEVLVPGDPERLATQERMQSGIPLHDDVINDLQVLAEKFSIQF